MLQETGATAKWMEYANMETTSTTKQHKPVAQRDRINYVVHMETPECRMLQNHKTQKSSTISIVTPQTKPTAYRISREKYMTHLTAEAVQGAALPLQSVDHIKRRDSLPLSMLSVGNSIADDALEERLENTTSLLVNH